RKLIILSDHRPLTWLFNLKNPLSKLARWRIQLEEYDYEIRYKPDALSRMYSIQEIKDESYEEFLGKMETQLITNSNVKETIGTLLEAPVKYHIVTETAKQYNLTSGINYEIKHKFGFNSFLPVSKVIGDTLSSEVNVRNYVYSVSMNDDLQWEKIKSMLSMCERRKQFRWKGMKHDLNNYVRNCMSCQVNTISNRHIQQPMAITLTSPLLKTLSSIYYILTMQDYLSKYTLGVPIPNHQANTVAEAFVIHFVCVHGILGTILTDIGQRGQLKNFILLQCTLYNGENIDNMDNRYPAAYPVPLSLFL
ncbi:Retrovirus-related Pol polyprotein from transposon 412, partial [Aphis craccivora]